MEEDLFKVMTFDPRLENQEQVRQVKILVIPDRELQGQRPGVETVGRSGRVL